MFARANKDEAHTMWAWQVGLIGMAAIGEGTALAALLGTPNRVHVSVVVLAWGFVGGFLVWGTLMNLLVRGPGKITAAGCLVAAACLVVVLAIPGAAIFYVLTIWRW